ncbi:hypothetical protein DMENIID0001_067200 [Sergentomyia squamirostris]
MSFPPRATVVMAARGTRTNGVENFSGMKRRKKCPFGIFGSSVWLEATPCGRYENGVGGVKIFCCIGRVENKKEKSLYEKTNHMSEWRDVQKLTQTKKKKKSQSWFILEATLPVQFISLFFLLHSHPIPYHLRPHVQ